MMSKSRIFILILICCSVFITTSLYSAEGNSTDSLLIQLHEEKNDTLKVEILLELAARTSWTDIAKYEEYARQALELSQNNNYLKGLAYSNYWLAKVFSEYEIDLSEKLIITALNYAEQINDSILIGMSYQVFGNLKYNVELYHDAKNYYIKALGIYLRHQQTTFAAGIYNNLGIINNLLASDTSSFEFYRKAVAINIQEGNHLKLGINYLNIGVDYFDIGELNKAKKYLELSLEVAHQHQFVRLYPWIYNNLSNYYLLVKDFKTSYDYANKALLLAREQSNRLQELGALQGLEEVSVSKSDIGQAYHYSKMINSLRDSINKNNRLRELDIMETRFKFEEQIKQKELERVKLQAEYYRKEFTYVLIILIAGLIISTILFLYFIQRNRTHRKNLEKEKFKQELEYKNKELTTNVMYLLRKNEFISNISEKLKNLTPGETEEKRELIRRIILELDKSISDSNWEEFEIRFQEVHVGFYNSLSQTHPDLTSNELRLCAFLRLNMTTKEIADITFQSPESIKKARYRLRKKLNLVRDDSLVTYLSKI